MRTAGRPALHVDDRGSGEPVLLITGWTISSAIFDPVVALYTPHVRCVSYDHRGSGRSAAWLGPVSMAMLATDAARVLDELGIESAHVAGVSMGGQVALELALRMPHRVKSLMLLGTGAGTPAPTPASLRDKGAAAGRLLRDSVERRRPSLGAALFSERFRREHPQRAADLARPFLQYPAPPWTAVSQLLASGFFDRVADLRRVRAPTLIVHGDADLLVPLDAAHVLAAGIPGAELHVVEGAGHGAALEAADGVARVLLDWVERQADAEPPPPPSEWERRRERATRPLALHSGALRLAARSVRPASWRGRGGRT